MDPVVAAALVSAGVSAIVTYVGQLHLARRASRMEAEAVLTKYREPLVGAAYDLQARLWNILRMGFFRAFYFSEDEAIRTYAKHHTLYLVGQYFAWNEILRREIRFLNFSDVRRTRNAEQRLEAVRWAFSTDEAAFGGPTFQLWRGDQRGLGERMIVRDDGQEDCIAYADFIESRERQPWRWLAKLERDLEAVAREMSESEPGESEPGESEPGERLRRIQNALIDLIDELDPDAIRFPPERRQKA
jgi:hypothetical protein